jgi:hypothetical protein
MSPRTEMEVPASPQPVRQADARLGHILAELVCGRAAMTQVLRARPSDAKQQADVRRKLLKALEAYADALGKRHLPVPPRLRDELSLQRQLATRR